MKKEDFGIEFADWINNNWFIPINEGRWRLEVENEEYTLDIPEVNNFSTKELMDLFLIYLQKIEDNKSEEEKIQEYLKEKLSKKSVDDVILDLRVYISYKPSNVDFYNKALECLERVLKEPKS
jgi:hypothetical protein